MPKKVTKKPFWLIYFVGFLTALATALPMYVQSSYISSIVGNERVGLVVAVGVTLLLIVILLYQKVLKRIGNYKATLAVVSLLILSVVLLYISQGMWQLVFYVCIIIGLGLLPISNDIFLERISQDNQTGRIRTTMLTFINIAILISPLIMGFIVGETENFKRVYLVGALALLPVIVLLLYKRSEVDDSSITYRSRSIAALKRLLNTHPNIPKILISEAALRFFYGTMVLYIPIYLHQHIGFSWPTIGGIFTVMLLPFILLQIPAGRIADLYLGEKEMIVAGLIIMAIFSFTIGFLDTTSVVVWGVILFMTRVGAALVESMNETHFFKQITSKDMDLIDMFRDLRPAGWLGASVIGFLVLSFFSSFMVIFIILSLVLVAAVLPIVHLHDSK